jgi:hypothetical protein
MSSKKRRGKYPRVVTASVAALVDGSKPFAVTYPVRESVSKELPAHMSITFSLKDWEGTTPVRFGQMVELMEVTKFVKGWRAASARPVTIRNGGRS